mgnify:CR=1 FL=1
MRDQLLLDTLIPLYRIIVMSLLTLHELLFVTVSVIAFKQESCCHLPRLLMLCLNVMLLSVSSAAAGLQSHYTSDAGMFFTVFLTAC